MGSIRLLSILLRRRRLRHCRLHCSVRARPLLSPLATPPCALAWGPPRSGNRRPDVLTGKDLSVASRRILPAGPNLPEAWTCSCRIALVSADPTPLPHASLDASTRRCSSLRPRLLVLPPGALWPWRPSRAWLSPPLRFSSRWHLWLRTALPHGAYRSLCLSRPSALLSACILSRALLFSLMLRFLWLRIA